MADFLIFFRQSVPNVWEIKTIEWKINTCRFESSICPNHIQFSSLDWVITDEWWMMIDDPCVHYVNDVPWGFITWGNWSFLFKDCTISSEGPPSKSLTAMTTARPWLRWSNWGSEVFMHKSLGYSTATKICTLPERLVSNIHPIMPSKLGQFTILML